MFHVNPTTYLEIAAELVIHAHSSENLKLFLETLPIY